MSDKFTEDIKHIQITGYAAPHIAHTKVTTEKNCYTYNQEEPKIYTRNKPYVDEDGIYEPCVEYTEKGTASNYKLSIPREIFIEAYEKFCKPSTLPSRDEYLSKSINRSPALYKCPKCGGNVRKDDAYCLTTYPSMYRYECDDCDYYEIM